MFLSLSQWLSYVESLHPQNIALGLERVDSIAEKLKLSTCSSKVFTIAGTNGKGSSAAFLSAILQAAGYRTAVYTSPHLLRFNERICINGALVSDEMLVEAFQVIEEGRGDTALTYFEFTTLAAFYLFPQANVDVWILEVGLGGRLDAVNLIDPDVAIITTIALDHMDWLGEDREKIGAEKAGIMRSHVPVVCGDSDPPNSLLSAAKRIFSPIFCINQHFSYAIHPSFWSFESERVCYPNLPLPSLPVQNAAAVLMALSLSGLEYDVSAVSQGLVSAQLMGRFQEVAQPVHTILDVAHNPQSGAYLAERLKQLPYSGKTLAVVGMLKDKDIVNTLKPLLSCVDGWYVASLDVPRGENAKNIANYLHELGVTAYDTAASPLSAYHSAVGACSASDRVVVFGSFYTVAEVLGSF
ncbi:MAG: FolC bifunctional protein [Gammaproteobacteria bacterium]|nr:FolC bifunctional protein [Gammaproteobacteria bacterium]